MRCATIGVCLLVGVGLAGCASVNKLVNGDTKPADESDVLSFQPLSTPPDYALVPGSTPASGQSASAQDPNATASDQYTGQSQTLMSSLGSTTNQAGATDPSVSTGEQALLDEANADKANPDIRDLLANDSTASDGVSKSLTDELILWNSNQQQGIAPSKSGTAPTITRVQATPLSGIFN